MILSRTSALVKLNDFAKRNLLQNKVNKGLENLRRSHDGGWVYRKQVRASPKHLKLAEYMGAVLWWWVTWNIVVDYKELLPPPIPDPSKWTDEELGIPPI